MSTIFVGVFTTYLNSLRTLSNTIVRLIFWCKLVELVSENPHLCVCGNLTATALIAVGY